MFGLANRLDGRFAPDTENDINRFRPSPSGELVWHLITQVNNNLRANYITVFELKWDKHRRFVSCLVYYLVYPSTDSNS